MDSIKDILTARLPGQVVRAHLNNGSSGNESRQKTVVFPDVCICTTLPGGEKMGYIYASFYSDGSRVTERNEKDDYNPDYGMSHRCVCRIATDDKRHREFLWGESNLPSGTWAFSDYLTHFAGETTELEQRRIGAFVAARDWAAGISSNSWLFMHGPMGTGKTFLASAIVSALIGADIHARYEYVPDLIDQLRRGQGDGTYEDTVAHLRAVSVLVLDDLNAAKTTEWADGEILKLIDWRYRERAPLLVTTNVPLNEMEPRTLDRLMDRQISATIPMVWESFRRVNESRT